MNIQDRIQRLLTTNASAATVLEGENIEHLRREAAASYQSFSPRVDPAHYGGARPMGFFDTVGRDKTDHYGWGYGTSRKAMERYAAVLATMGRRAYEAEMAAFEQLAKNTPLTDKLRRHVDDLRRQRVGVTEGSGRFGVDLNPDSISKEEAEMLLPAERIRLSKESPNPRPWKVTIDHKGDRRVAFVTTVTPGDALGKALHRLQFGSRPALVRHCIHNGESSARVFDERFQIARNFR